MKTFRFNFLTFAAVTLGALLFVTCCDEDDPDSLSVSQKEFTFEADDTGNQSAEVTTSAANWHAESSNSWLGFSTNGNSISISVEKYTNTEGPRTGEIIIRAGTAEPVSISVTQKAQHSLSLSPESLSFEPDGSAQEVTITTTAPSWEATKTSDADWFSLSKQGDKLTVTVNKNTNTEGREAAIKITAGNAAEKTLTVTQGKSHTLSISPASLTFAPSATAAQTVTVTTTAPSWVATPSDNWVTLTPQDDKLHVSVSENDGNNSRSATITITAGTAPERTITVSQNPHTLSVSTASLSFTASATSAQSVTVTTTASSWNATTTDNWIQLTNQGNTIRVTVESNPNTSDRSGTIRVKAGTLERTVNVIQKGAEPDYISVSSASLNFIASSPSAQTVTVTTNVSSWNATTTASWLTLTQQSNTLRVSATTNTSSARNATIRFTAGTASVTVSVTQTGVNPWPVGNFTASGNATLIGGLPADNPWSGKVTQYPTSGTPSYLTISNWGGYTDEHQCYYSNGKITINGSKLLLEESGIRVYFKAIIIDSSKKTWQDVSNYYETKYNSTTRVWDFSGKYNGFDVLVGAVFLDSSNGLVAAVTFSNARLTMTSTSSTPAQPGDIDRKATTLLGSGEKGNTLQETISEIKKAPSSIIYKKVSSIKDSK